MKRLQLVMMLLLVGCTLASCGKARQSELDRGVSAIEDAMNAGENDATQRIHRIWMIERGNFYGYGRNTGRFPAGGIQAGEFLMHYDELVNGTALDKIMSRMNWIRSRLMHLQTA